MVARAVDNVLWILLLHFFVVLRVLCIVAMVLLCSFESVLSKHFANVVLLAVFRVLLCSY